MHDNGWVRSTIHSGVHAGQGVAAKISGDKAEADRQFARAKEQWDRVDNNKFGKTTGPGYRGDNSGRGISRSRSPVRKEKK